MSSSTDTTSTPPSGDGKSLQSPAWSSGIINNPSATPQYVVDDIVSSPRYVRVTLSEARAMQDVGKKVFNGTTLQPIAKGQLPTAPTGTSGPTNQPFETQNQEIADAENAVSMGGGDGAQAYNDTQVHHGDALADSDRENTGNSSDEQDGEYSLLGGVYSC